MSDTQPTPPPSPKAGKTRRRLSARYVRRRTVVVLFVALASALFLHRGVVVVMHPSPPLPPMPLPYPYIASPNCDDRPPGVGVTCITLHATVVPTVEGTVRVFLTPEKKVSAHFVVGKEGQVVQMVPVERRAWHAGISVLDGVASVNDYSVGIEMVNRNNGSDPYPEAQYQAVAGIIRFLRSRYAIPDARIVSHAQIALPPGRKSDPLGFDFNKIRVLAK